MDEARRREAMDLVQEFRQNMEAATAGDPAVAIAKRYHRLAAPERDEYLSSLVSHSRYEARAWDGLILIVRQYRDADRPVPRELVTWLIDAVEGRTPRPRRDSFAKEQRDLLISTCVGLLVSYGFTPTRNIAFGPDVGDGDSACDVVGQVFADSKIGYKAVEGIWTQSLIHRADVRSGLERAAVLIDKGSAIG